MPTNPDQLKAAIDADDVRAVRSLLESEPGLVKQYMRRGERHYHNQRPLTYAAQRGRVEIVKLLLEAGADVHEDGNLPLARASLHDRNIPVMEVLVQHGAHPNGDAYDWGPVLTHPCESLAPESIKWLIAHGADPNRREPNLRYTGTPLGMVIGGYLRSDRMHDCVNALIEGGAEYEDGPVMDIHRGRLDVVEKRLDDDPDLVHSHFDLPYGNYLTLMGVTLLHVAAEYNELACAAMLLERGADLNAQARVGKSGAGGQTPVFHAIGNNQGACYPLFEYLLDRGPDLSVRARIQADVFMSNDPDHVYDEVLDLTPLGYALRYEREPEWREASREVAKLRELGAPET